MDKKIAIRMKFLKNNAMKKILAQRAALLAMPKNELSLAEKSPILLFEIGKNQKYGIPYIAVDKVIISQKITPVPGLNPLFSGIIYHNSEVWPLVNTATLFDCKESGNESHFILLHSHMYRYGLVVGSIIGKSLYDESIELSHLPADNTKKQSYILGIYQGDIALVNMKEIVHTLNTIYS